jgi:hypothetical protein
MDHVITSAKLRLRYLCDTDLIRGLDARKILDDLVEPATRYSLSWWFASTCLSDLDHVVLATDYETDRYVGLLAANDGATAAETYLDLQAAFVIDAMHGSMLMRRMLAFAMLRIAALGTLPRVIAARTSTPCCYRLLSLFSQTIPDATVFPEIAPNAINLRGAGLARRIARRMAPTCEYETATGTIRHSRLSNRSCFTRTTVPDPDVEKMFATRLGDGDQIMVVVDMSEIDESAITVKTREIVRKRWKAPVERGRYSDAGAPRHTDWASPTLTA